MSDWYLAYTKPKSEDNVAYRLTSAGFEVLNPKIMERKYYRRKITEVTSALFPCYIFVRFDKLKSYHLIRYTRGIKWVLRNENGPAEVPDRIVGSIAGRMNGGVIEVRPQFTPGETVLVKGGPFEGFSAVFEREMSGIERVSILLKAVNVRLVIDRSMIAGC